MNKSIGRVYIDGYGWNPMRINGNEGSSDLSGQIVFEEIVLNWGYRGTSGGITVDTNEQPETLTIRAIEVYEEPQSL